MHGQQNVKTFVYLLSDLETLKAIYVKLKQMLRNVMVFNFEWLQILCLFNWTGDRIGFCIYFQNIRSVVSCKSSVMELGFVERADRHSNEQLILFLRGIRKVFTVKPLERNVL